MNGTRKPGTGHHDTETAVLVLHSALRRRGVAARDGDLSHPVRVEHAGRRTTVRLVDHHWRRPVPGSPDASVSLAREGHEDHLARHLVTELLGYL